MIHAFRFDAASNGVTYQSRFTGDATERAIQSVPKDQYRAIHISMRQRPESAFGRLMHAFGPLTKDPKLGDVPFNTSVTLEKLPTRGILNASTDANVIHKLDPETLRVTDRYDFSYFSPELDKSMCLSHGTLDDVTGEYFNCMANYSPVKTEYTVFRIDSSGKANVLAKVKDFTYYMHSLALTKSYVIMAMGPAQIDLFPLLRGKSFTEACEMRPNTPTRFVVINRQSGGIVAEYEHEQFFNFHTFNAFEQDGDIMIDRSLFSDCKILQELWIDNMTQGGNVARVKPVRFTLPNIADVGARYSTSMPKASFRVLADVALEFATVSPRKRERPYHYVFGVSDNDGKQFSSSIAKVNVDTGIVTSYVLPQRTFGEPIFVPDPSGNEEDAGCLVVLALDDLKDSSALLVLDARAMTEVARAELPMRLPPSFHGAFHT